MIMHAALFICRGDPCGRPWIDDIKFFRLRATARVAPTIIHSHIHPKHRTPRLSSVFHRKAFRERRGLSVLPRQNR